MQLLVAQLLHQLALPFGEVLHRLLFVLGRLAGPVLQFLEGLVGQPLLIAQRFAEVLHRLCAGHRLAAFAAGHLQIVEQFVELRHQVGGLVHPALFHQLLDAVHHLLDLALVTVWVPSS